MGVKQKKKVMSAHSLIVQSRMRADRQRMKAKAFNRYRKNWDWKGMLGSAACIKWSFRDLENLDTALTVVPQRRTVVQAGGNIGIFAKRLAEEFKRVITFEPDDKLFRALKINAPEKNIEAHMAAVGNARDGVTLSFERRDDSGRPAHEGLTHVVGSGPIPQVLIDDFNLTDCDLIYLDIEGFELNALRGAAQTIERCRPVIGVELNGSTEYYGHSEAAVREFIVSRGYRLVLRQHSDEVYVPQEFAT